MNVDTTDERQALVRSLISRPWLTKEDDPDRFARVKDHFEYLRDWFYDHTGYALLVTRNFAKLEKAPAVFHTWMGMSEFYSARDYGLFTYGLWYLEGKSDGEQFLLSEMVETIRDHLLGDGLDIDWAIYDHRLSMVRALKKLRDIGAISSIEGEESGWAREEAGSNVLYEASPLARYVLRRFPKELMAYQAVDELYEVEQIERSPVEADALSSQTETRARRHKVFRRLLFEPVVYDWSWTEDERRYVQTQRSWIIHQIEEATGLAGRRFREGLYFFWPELLTEMDLFPTQAAVSDLVLLLAKVLRDNMALQTLSLTAHEVGCIHLTRGEFENALRTLREAYEPLWTKDHREKTTSQLAIELITHMEAWNLCATDGANSVVLYPALSRFCGAYAKTGQTADEQPVGGNLA